MRRGPAELQADARRNEVKAHVRSDLTGKQILPNAFSFHVKKNAAADGIKLKAELVTNRTSAAFPLEREEIHPFRYHSVDFPVEQFKFFRGFDRLIRIGEPIDPIIWRKLLGKRKNSSQRRMTSQKSQSKTCLGNSFYAIIFISCIRA